MWRIPLFPGFAALRAPLPFPLAAGALAKRYIIKESAAGRPPFRLRPLPYRSKLLAAVDVNEISIACAMLTP